MPLYNHTYGHIYNPAKSLKPTFLRLLRTLSGVFIIFALAVFFASCGDSGKNAQRGALPVSTIEIAQANIPLEFEYPARLKSVQSADVYARVEGILLSQNFKEGDIVLEGQPLFQIDPKRYQARVTMARAQYDSAKANLDKAKRDWERTEALYKQGALTIDTYDNALYNYQSAKANVDNTKASLDDALIDLGYTKVVASFTGRIGMRRHDIGALVGAQGSNVLSTLTQLTPIYAEFSIPSNDFYYIRDLEKTNIIAQVILGNDKLYDTLGSLNFVDSVIDQNTSSVKARAIFENEKYTLVPNEFVRVKLEGFEAKNAIAIPQNALLQDSQGSYVYVMKEGKAQIERVTLGKMLKNGLVLIINGLKSKDIVVTSDLTKISQGMPLTSKGSANPPPKTTPKGQNPATPSTTQK